MSELLNPFKELLISIGSGRKAPKAKVNSSEVDNLCLIRLNISLSFVFSDKSVIVRIHPNTSHFTNDKLICSTLFGNINASRNSA